MSIQHSENKQPEKLTELMVEKFLRENPDFFERHQKLLTILKLPHDSGEGTISLIEKQITLLREKNRSLDRKLLSLVQIARENERLSVRLHKLSNGLLEARNFSDVLAVTHDVVRDLFETDFVVVKLLANFTDDVHIQVSEDAHDILFKEFFAADAPVCGRLTAEQIEYLFGDNSSYVTSSAMIPLKGVKSLGILALGSVDAQRFSPAMGHLFLSHLGDLVSSALTVHLEAGAAGN